MRAQHHVAADGIAQLGDQGHLAGRDGIGVDAARRGDVRRADVQIDHRQRNVEHVVAGGTGNDVVLTLDTKVQSAAAKALVGRVGACVVLDPRTGRPTPGGFDAPVHATVLAPTAVDAEMHATMALVRGAQHALPGRVRRESAERPGR